MSDAVRCMCEYTDVDWFSGDPLECSRERCYKQSALSICVLVNIKRMQINLCVCVCPIHPQRTCAHTQLATFTSSIMMLQSASYLSEACCEAAHRLAVTKLFSDVATSVAPSLPSHRFLHVLQRQHSKSRQDGVHRTAGSTRGPEPGFTIELHFTFNFTDCGPSHLKWVSCFQTSVIRKKQH